MCVCGCVRVCVCVCDGHSTIVSATFSAGIKNSIDNKMHLAH